MEEEVVYTPEQVAEMLKMSKDYVYDRVEDGKLKCYRLGSRIRFSMRQVEEFLERHKEL